MLAIDFNGKGDVTESNVQWTFGSNMPSKPSLVIVEENLYAISDKGILSCLDAKTGKQKYKQRIGGSFAASPLYAGGKIYLFDTDGKTTIFEPGDSYQPVKTNQLDGEFMASPAVAGQSLILPQKSLLVRPLFALALQRLVIR